MEQKKHTDSLLPGFKSLGDCLRHHRHRLGLSQEALAEAIGASARSIGRWEQNLSVPQELLRTRLSQVFGLDPQYFLVNFSREDTPPSPVWVVPFSRNPFFTGREEVLQTLHRQLTNEAQTQAIALSGLGGIGKTQVAIEYAYRYAPDYCSVFWLAAGTVESLIKSLQELAEQLQLPQMQVAEQAQVVRAVQQWLNTHSAWLLIADNVEDLDLLQEVIPPRRQGALLLTTRRQALGPMVRPLPLLPMNKQEGVVLLLRRARQTNVQVEKAAPLQEFSTLPDATLAMELVRLLQGLPLALDQAGAYLEETGCSVAEYLQRYHHRRKEVLDRRGMHAGSHPESVSTTLKLSIQRISQLNPTAAELLRVCAFLSGESIAEDLLAAGACHLGPILSTALVDPYQLDLALATLRTASLVTRSPEEQTLSVHRLVQAVLQDQMEAEEVRIWSERVIRMVNAALPERSSGTWDHYERYLVQALACVPLMTPIQSSLPEAGELLSKVGNYLMTRGRYQEAEPLLERTATLSGSDPTTMLARLEKRAELSWRQGHYDHAQELLQWILGLEQQRLGAQHPKTSETLNNVALVSWSQGKYREAEPLYLQALHIREQQLGPTHLKTAETLNNLGLLYRSQGKYREAERLYLRALHIKKLQLGHQHPKIIVVLHNLANVYRLQGKYEEAERLLKQALSIREQELELDHPDTAFSLRGLANVYRDQRRYEEAERLYQQALSIQTQQVGSAYPRTAETLDGLAGVYQDQRKYEEAASLYEQALGIKEQYLGPEHPEIAFTLGALASVYREQGRDEEAEQCYQRALGIGEQQLGSAHPEMSKIRDDYHRLLEQRKRMAEKQSAEYETPPS